MNSHPLTPTLSLKRILMLLLLFCATGPLLAQRQSTRFVHQQFDNGYNFFCYLNHDTIRQTGRLMAQPPGSSNPSLFGFIEFNDGSFAYTDYKYVTNPEDYSMFSIRKPGFQINPAHLGGAPAILKLYGIYGRPPRKEAIAARMMEPSDNFLSPNVLPRSFSMKPLITQAEGLKISPSIRDIAPEDPMIFVLTYKIPITSNWNTLAFTYNRNWEGKTMSIFRPLSGDTRDKICNLDNPDETDIPAIRCYGKEIAVADENNNAIYFNNLVKDGREHNIFISLMPNDNLDPKQETQLQLGAFNTDVAGSNLQDKHAVYQTDTFLRTASSHDPNSIDVWPGCFDSTCAPLLLNYAVRFQNLGRNEANTVKVEVMLGNHIDMNTIRNISVNCGGVTAGYKRRPGPIGLHKPYYSYTILGQSIIFTIKRAKLQKVLSIADMNLISTMGEIRFRVTTGPMQKTDSIESSASIIFDTNEPVKVEDPARVDFSSPCRPSRPWISFRRRL